METQVAITPDDVAQIVAQLTPEQLKIAYEFMAFLRSRSSVGIEDELSREFFAWEMASETDAALFDTRLELA